MKNIFSSIHLFFTRPMPADTLGIFRIAVSAFALIQFFVLLPDWSWIYGPKGLLPWDVSEALSTNHMPALSDVLSYFRFLHLTPNGVLYLITTVYFLSLAGLLVGYKTRLMGCLAWLTHLMLNTTGHFTAYGVETFAHISLFYCMVLPVGAAFSLDVRRKPSSVAPQMITLSIRVIQLHLAIMYMASGLEKSMGSQWWNGEAVWIALQQDQFHQVNTGWMAAVPIIPTFLCWSTLLVETLYPIGMLWKRTRKFWLIGITGMHLFIGLFLGLQLFGGLMILLNLSAFGREIFPKIFTIRTRAPWGKKWEYKTEQVGEVYIPA